MDPKDIEANAESVALEDLLRLKRHERPDPQFWTQFESDFKKRTLQELVAKPRFRDMLGQWFLRSGSRWIPAGAVAAAALYFANGMLIQGPASVQNSPEINPTHAVAPELASLAFEDISNKSGSELEIIPEDSIDSSESWTEAKADFTVDVIVVEKRPTDYSTDFSSDTLTLNLAEPASYPEDVFTSNIATLYPSAFRLGM
ncbi:MAG: hypothetical protein AAF212_09055 [Verrucomicrobiota bacterium]